MLIDHEFYGYEIIQNPSNSKLKLYVGGINAEILRDVVSVDNAVKWDPASNIWKGGGRNRTINDKHWESIKEFLSSTNQEGILPSAIVISADDDAFEFDPHPNMSAIDRVTPGKLTLRGRYDVDPDNPGNPQPVDEPERTAWVLDGQHRIKAFRAWSMPEPFPVNVIVIKRWHGDDYEDVMRHQTYELNMGRPLSDDFKAAVREQYDQQVGHKEYKREIAMSWIRKDMEGRGRVFSPKDIVGASNLRTPYVVSMSFVEKLIALAFAEDSYLHGNFSLEKMDKNDVQQVGKYLFDFYEGVRLSLGLINPNVKGTIGAGPEVVAAQDYWDIATSTGHKQRLLHNVGLKAVTRGLLNAVMRSNAQPSNPMEVAELLSHMRGISWHHPLLQAKKDDWVGPLATALKEMYDSPGTSNASKKYQLFLKKKDKSGNVIDDFKLDAFGW